MKSFGFKRIGVIALCIISLPFIVLVLPWALIFLDILLSPAPPKPEITYGEFPFRLEYELNGERKVVEDTLICEFDGFGMDEGRGKFRRWKERFASGNEEVLLLKVDVSKKIYYQVGGAYYYMGDMPEATGFKHEFPNASIEQRRDNLTSDSTIFAEDLFSEFGIKLISWDYTQPIINTFEAKK